MRVRPPASLPGFFPMTVRDLPHADQAILHEILSTADLAHRPARAPAHELESKTLIALAHDFARDRPQFFDHLARAARALCQAGSAGISLSTRLPSGERVFRWLATAGAYFPLVGSTLPRFFSPCGIVLDRNSPQLMTHPARYFPYIADISPAVAEVLLVPFHRHEIPIGTIWIVAHDHQRRFDAEDVRLLTGLSSFASAAAQVLEDGEERA